MDGIHDLGGRQGFGPVDAPPEEPVFAEDWERRVMRVNLAGLIALSPSGGRWRHAIERMDPGHYLTSSYYEHWLTGITTLFVESGLVTQDELERRAGGSFPLSRPDRGHGPAHPEHDHTEPRLEIGAHVRVREWHPPGHTRAPAYVQGRRGVITRIDGAYNVPDIEAHGDRKVLDPTYSVQFRATDLWGEDGDDDVTINVDLWECYLEADP